MLFRALEKIKLRQPPSRGSSRRKIMNCIKKPKKKKSKKVFFELNRTTYFVQFLQCACYLGTFAAFLCKKLKQANDHLGQEPNHKATNQTPNSQG